MLTATRNVRWPTLRNRSNSEAPHPARSTGPADQSDLAVEDISIHHDIVNETSVHETTERDLTVETPAWASARGSAELTAYLDAADFSLLAAALESPR